MKEAPIQQYCRQVGSRLNCGGKMKARLLGDLRADLLQRELPEDTELPALCALLGEPEAVAGEMRRSLDLRPDRRKKLAYRAFLIALTLAVSLWAGFILWTMYTSRGGYIVHTPVVTYTNETEGE